MRSAEQTYPPDEFDTVAPSGPRGAHRAPRSRWSRWWPFVAVLVLFPVLAFAGVTWLSNWDGLPGALDPGVLEPDDGTEEEPTAPEAEETAEPEETTEPEETQEPEATQEPEPEPDLTLAVDVLNSTSISGLAGGAGETLEAAGFTAVSTGNWQETDPEASVVWFPAEEDEVTARAVAQTLGITTVEPSGEVDTITAVLAPDFAE